MPIDIIKDPVTGKQYSRDTSVTGSTYAPYTAPASVKEETPAGDLPPLPSESSAVGDLGNLRIALREALNEAARKRVENNFNIVAPFTGNQPGTIGSVVDMIR